jgi:hypothetical protein
MLNARLFNRQNALIIALAILLVLCYQMAFKKTIAAWQLNQTLKNQLSQSTGTMVPPDYIARKNLNLSKILELYNADTTNFRSNTLGKISFAAEKENVSLSEVPVADPLNNNKKFRVEKLVFKGDYFSLLKILAQLRLTKNIGFIRSVAIKNPARNNDKNSASLSMELFFLIKK